MGCATDRVSDHCLGYCFSTGGCLCSATIALSQSCNRRSRDLPAGDGAGTRTSLSGDFRVHVFACEARSRPGFLALHRVELAQKLVNLFAGRYGALICLARDRPPSSYPKRTADGPLLSDAGRSLGTLGVRGNLRTVVRGTFLSWFSVSRAVSPVWYDDRSAGDG